MSSSQTDGQYHYEENHALHDENNKQGNHHHSNSSNGVKCTSQGRWNKEEHQRFLDSLKMYGKNWKLVEEYVQTRTGAQIRSHAQKFFNRIEKQNQQQQTEQLQQHSSETNGLEKLHIISNEDREENAKDGSKMSPKKKKLFKTTSTGTKRDEEQKKKQKKMKPMRQEDIKLKPEESEQSPHSSDSQLLNDDYSVSNKLPLFDISRQSFCNQNVNNQKIVQHNEENLPKIEVSFLNFLLQQIPIQAINSLKIPKAYDLIDLNKPDDFLVRNDEEYLYQRPRLLSNFKLAQGFEEENEVNHEKIMNAKRKQSIEDSFIMKRLRTGSENFFGFE